LADIREQSLAGRYRALLEVAESLVSYRGLAELFRDLPPVLHRVARFDLLALVLHEPARGIMRLHVLENREPAANGQCIEMHLGDGPAGLVWHTQRPWVHPDIEQEKRFPRITEMLRKQGVRSICMLPLSTHHCRLGALGFGSRDVFGYPESDLEYMSMVAGQVALAVDNAISYRQLAELKEKLESERLYLEDEIRTRYNAGEIVGESDALKHVLREVETVAPIDSTVFIRGESGTGKELIARAIHSRSRRRERTFVKLDCASVPPGLLEAELFGCEPGSGDAAAAKPGRFELADHGTLFLDDIGAIPMELQPKLLRVLQEREFERVGGRRTLRVDVRLVAATSRDLPEMVASREFRSDLYYRISVFPLVLPPLRERPGDVPLLVSHFTRRFARRLGRPVETIPPETMQALAAWPWPGNVRELENFVERAVILSRGTVLEAPLGELRRAGGRGAVEALHSMEDAEREHILRALERTGWVVGGRRGAAALLGMKRTTLQSRMQKLGVSGPRERTQPES
jgi:formate hydrogenlyase transcriptional activator